MKKVYRFSLLFTLFSCTGSPPPSNLVPIAGVTEPTLCTGYVNPAVTTCSETCLTPENHVASEGEKAMITQTITENKEKLP